MERPIFQPLGSPALDLDTPALVADLDVMVRNIETVHSIFRESTAKIRPHVSCHGCPNIARVQLAAAETVGGIAVATVGEAEVFSDAGFTDIFVANQIVTRPKIRRLCALAHNSVIAVAVDSPDNVAALSTVAADVGVTLGVLVEIDAGQGRCGVAPGAPAGELVKAVSAAPKLTFNGLIVSEGSQPTQQRLSPVLETVALLEQSGLPAMVVSVAVSADYREVASVPGVTEVLAGTYVLGDYELCQQRAELFPAARVLSSVLSHPVAGRAVVDAGHKATGPDLGIAVADGVPGAVAARFSAEHGILDLEGTAVSELVANDKVWLIPYNLALCVNQYDYFRAVRNDRLEGFWPIASRGRFD